MQETRSKDEQLLRGIAKYVVECEDVATTEITLSLLYCKREEAQDSFWMNEYVEEFTCPELEEAMRTLKLNKSRMRRSRQDTSIPRHEVSPPVVKKRSQLSKQTPTTVTELVEERLPSFLRVAETRRHIRELIKPDSNKANTAPLLDALNAFYEEFGASYIQQSNLTDNELIKPLSTEGLLDTICLDQQ